MTHEGSSPLETFSAYQSEQAVRLEELAAVLAHGIELTTDLEACSRKLEASNRPDLAMKERAIVLEFAALEDFPQNANNFTPSFQFTLGRNNEKRAISKEELQLLREGVSADDIFGIKHANAYVHDSPSFSRMLVLFPEFSDSFIQRFSHPTADKWVAFRPELFVAYQLMSRLIDVSDERAMIDGVPDKWYLCH